MNRLRARTIAALLLSLIFTASCATSSIQSVPMPADVSALPANGSCRIYVARSDQFWGKVRSIDVVDRGVDIGTLGEDGYLCWDREPDQTPIELYYNASFLDGGVVEGQLAFDGKPGMVYYYAIHLRKGDRKPEVNLLDAEAGRALIAKRSPAKVE